MIPEKRDRQLLGEAQPHPADVLQYRSRPSSPSSSSDKSESSDSAVGSLSAESEDPDAPHRLGLGARPKNEKVKVNHIKTEAEIMR
jgi:hypothetical protein